MKHKIILFIKSYKPDFLILLKLLESIERFNVDKIPVYLSVNDEDFDFFNEHIKSKLTLLKDSDIVKCSIQDPWRYQQIIKSSVYKLQICEDYLCLDSDSLFITKFYKKDFLYNDSTPYTVMHEAKSFQETMERIGLDSKTLFFKEAVIATRKVLNINDTDKIWDYGPSPYLWSTKVWEEIEKSLAKKDKNLETLLMEINEFSDPSENVIYGEYLRINKPIELIAIDPFFKVYHYKKQFLLEQKFHKIEKLNKIYLGVIFQSNWKRSLFDSIIHLFK